MKTKTKIILALAALVVIGVAVWFGVIYFTHQNRYPSVQTEAVSTRSITSKISAKGTVELISQVSVFPATQAKVDKVFVKVGDTVKVGDPLVTYSGDTLQSYRDQLDAANLTLKSAQISLDAAKALPGQSQSSVKSQVDLQEVQVEQAQLNVDKIQRAIDAFVPEQFAETAGTVLALGVSAGSMTNSSQAIMTVADTSVNNLRIRVYVSESYAAELAEGQDVSITGVALGDKTYSGKVGKISATASQKQIGNSMVNVLTVDVIPDETAEGLKAGYSIDSEITVSDIKDAVVVPIMATLTDSDGNDYVYVVDADSKVTKRVVKLGGYDGTYIQADGVNVGELVIVSPPSQITDGSYVK